MHCENCWFWMNSSYILGGENISKEGYCRIHCKKTFAMDVCKWIQFQTIKKGIIDNGPRFSE